MLLFRLWKNIKVNYLFYWKDYAYKIYLRVIWDVGENSKLNYLFYRTDNTKVQHAIFWVAGETVR